MATTSLTISNTITNTTDGKVAMNKCDRSSKVLSHDNRWRWCAVCVSSKPTVFVCL